MKKMLGLFSAIIILFALIGCVPITKQVSGEEGLNNDKKTPEIKMSQTEETPSLSGEIDSLKAINEFLPKRGEVALILIGFKDGSGIVAKGTYPGLKEGKRVRLYLKPSDTEYKGSQAYEIYRIESLQ